MATVVYALFSDKQAAEAAATELSARAEGRPNFPVQTHARAPLDGNYLPESATEIGRNTMIAMVAGAGVGTLIGVVAAASFDIMGLTVAIGAGLGLLTGILSGLLGGMMAGTRQPKAELRALAAHLPGGAEGPSADVEGAVLLTVELDDPAHVETVEDILEAQGGEDIGEC